VAYRI
jgi:hypothetical protein